ncbi:MAG: carboxypeptidase-like regulatory domain-containing protein, partial [Bacteroidaceae bacterium]|nr:carboxypeptidase-like regulatory domain-containing protein [Bacteroidaceae bacterium]
MKELFRYIVLAIMIVAGSWPAALPAQNVFTARVVDAESGEALPMVGVYVSENNATLTNFDGDFS